MTAAIGSRGRTARALAARPAADAECRGKPFPCITVPAAVRAPRRLRPAPAPTTAAACLGSTPPRRSSSPRPTPSRAASCGLLRPRARYGLYVVASNDQAPFRQHRPGGDPRPRRPRPARGRVRVRGDEPAVYNEVFLWGRATSAARPAAAAQRARAQPQGPADADRAGPRAFAGPGPGGRPARNLQPSGCRAPSAARLRDEPARVPLRRPAAGDPCADVTATTCAAWTARRQRRRPGRCEPGPVDGPDGDGVQLWQPLSWMTSTWRAVVDPDVRFAYDVTPMLVGNLGDLVFDGQSAITQRGGAAGPGCHYVGNATWTGGEDRTDLTEEAGPNRRVPSPSRRGSCRVRSARGRAVSGPPFLPRARLSPVPAGGTTTRRDGDRRRPAAAGRPPAPGLRRCALRPPCRPASSSSPARRSTTSSWTPPRACVGPSGWRALQHRAGRWRGSSSRPRFLGRLSRDRLGDGAASPAGRRRRRPRRRRHDRRPDRRSPSPRSTRRAARATASTSARRPRRGWSRTSRSRRCRLSVATPRTSGRSASRSSRSRRPWRRWSSGWPARPWSRWTRTCRAGALVADPEAYRRADRPRRWPTHRRREGQRGGPRLARPGPRAGRRGAGAARIDGPSAVLLTRGARGALVVHADGERRRPGRAGARRRHDRRRRRVRRRRPGLVARQRPRGRRPRAARARRRGRPLRGARGRADLRARRGGSAAPPRAPRCPPERGSRPVRSGWPPARARSRLGPCPRNRIALDDVLVGERELWLRRPAARAVQAAARASARCTGRRRSPSTRRRPASGRSPRPTTSTRSAATGRPTRPSSAGSPR